MQTTVSITRKWQIHIPKAIRQKLKLDQPVVADITTEKGKIIITPKKSAVLELAGKYHQDYIKNPIDVDNIRDYIDYS